MATVRSLLGRARARVAGRSRQPNERGAAVILMYHRVAAVASDPWRLAVAPDRFSEQLEMLRADYDVLPLRELVAAVAAGDPPRRSVAVTFDDGYVDTLLAAKPALEASGVPATIFVTTGTLDSGGQYWWEELEDFAGATGGDVDALWRELRSLPYQEQRAALDALWAGERLERPADVTTPTSAQVAELPSALVEVGAHTQTHAPLSSLTPAAQHDEIVGSKQHLEQMLGRTVDLFAYPYGDYGAETPELVRAAGFLAATTTERGAVTGASDPYTLPRLHAEDWAAEELAAHIEAWLLP